LSHCSDEPLGQKIWQTFIFILLFYPGTLYVRVIDINEHDPVFIDTEKMAIPHYNITLREELPLDTFVVTMVATDVDSSEISAYKMKSDGNGFFAIQQKTGKEM
jgi:hypothetical protein